MSRAAPAPGPAVPQLGGARAWAWGALALAALWGGAAPPEPGPFAPVRRDGACRLGIRGEGPACPCEELDARTRLALGLPVALDRLGTDELELIDGIGPARALAIAAEREREPFGSSEALAGRVAGIGPVTAARVAAQLAGRPDGACESRDP